MPADEAFELEKAQIAIRAGVLSKSEIRRAMGFSDISPEEFSNNPAIAADAITATPADQAMGTQ